MMMIMEERCLTGLRGLGPIEEGNSTISSWGSTAKQVGGQTDSGWGLDRMKRELLPCRQV